MKRAASGVGLTLIVVLIGVLAGLLVTPANGQVSKGSISGAVVDAQGAAVGDASIRVISRSTNQEFTTTSDSAGLFRLSLLPPDSYRLEVSKQGFRKLVIDQVDVVVGADFGVGNIKLEVGEITSTVEVSGAPPLLESTEAQVTNAFASENIEAFPGVLENQGLDKLALTVPGVVNNRGISFSNTNGTGFAVNGIRGRNNDQQIDGQNNNDNSVGGPGLFVSDPEFVQEYQITTSNFGAEYGRNSGSVVNIITKSGTNNFHGSIFGTESNSALDALSNTQKAFEGLKKPARYNDEFTGGTIGGPIRKDHLFFFGGFDNEIVSQQQVYTSGNDTSAPLTPTPAGITTMLACYGNTPSMQALQKYGPYAITGGNPTPVPGTITVPTPGPGQTKSPTLTNCTDGVTRTLELGQVGRTLSTGSKSYNFPIKLDLQTAKNHFYGRYLYNKNTNFNGDSFATAAAGYPNNVPALSQDYGFSWVRTISTRMSNEFRASYGRLNVEFGGNSIGNTIPNQGDIGQAIARITFSASNLLGFGPATNAPQGRIVNTYQGQDNWSYFLGRHGLKAGVNFTYQRSPNIFLPNFNGAYRFSTWAAYGADTPNRIQIAQGSPSLDFREYDTFAYFGDDFKVRNNFTLNLGVTWSYYGQPANLFHQITVKNQSGSSPLWNPALPASITEFPEIPAPKNSWGPSVGFAWTPGGGGFLTGHGKTVLRGGYRLSYDPPFYNIYVNISSSAPIVFLQTLSTSPGALPVGTHQLPANPTGPNVRADLAPALVRGVFDPRTFNDTSITPNFGPQKTHEWSFGLQRELHAGAVFEARYVGNRGTNLFQSINGNPRIDGLLAAFPNLVPSGVTPCTTPTTILGPGQTAHPELGRENCNQGIVRTRTNSAYSDYHGLQTEVRGHQLWHQFTLKSAYTFSKTTDNATEIFTPGTSIAPAFAQSQVNFTGQEHGISSLNFQHNWSASFVEEIPAFRAQHGIVGHVLGGWAVSGTYFIVSGQPYTPWQNSLNCFSVDRSARSFALGFPSNLGCNLQSSNASAYDLPFTFAFVGSDQSLRPFLGNAAAPVGTVGIFAGDACLDFGAFDASGVLHGPGCGLPTTQLLSLNAINAGGTVTNLTSKDVRFIVNGQVAGQQFGTPFGNVGRNVLNDARTNIGNFELFKTVSVKERLKVTWHMSMINVFNHPNFYSVDPFVDDAGFAKEGQGFANPSLTSGGIRGGGNNGNPGRSIRFGLKIAF